MDDRKLLVGATIPSGLQSVKEFEQLKLGELVLVDLPEEADKATEIMQYCHDHGIYVILGEIARRGHLGERRRFRELTREQINRILAAAGEYYLGRYTICEAGGMAYWPKEYLKNQNAKVFRGMAPARDMKEAKGRFLEYVRAAIAQEVPEIANGPLIADDSSMLFKYQAEAGADRLNLEMFPGNPLRMLPAIRGSARAFDKPWGVEIAIAYYAGFDFDDLWMKRWRQSLYLSYLAGAELIFPESGYYDFRYETGGGTKFFAFDSDTMKEARAVLREFYRFHKIHPRPNNTPRVKLAVISGQCDGCPGLWNKYAWGQYEAGTQWKDSDAERSWKLTDLLTTRENTYSELQLGRNSYSGNPPYGQYDILPAEAPLEVMQRYSDLVFLGYNLMDGALYDKLVAYVKAGGNLLMWLPHCNVNPARGGEIDLFNQGDLHELFGVKVTGRLPREVLGVKTIGRGELPLPCRGLWRDPVMLGDVNCAKVEITSTNVTITAGFTGILKATVEELEKRPALIEYRLGKGKARLVPALDYPGAPGMLEWAEHLLRVISLYAQGDIRLLCADSIRYAVYDADGYSELYALNAEFDITQMVRVVVNGSAASEMPIPASSMGLFFIRRGLVIHPELKESAVISWQDDSCTLVSMTDQMVTLANTTDTNILLSLNGSLIMVPANGTITVACRENHGSVPDVFFAKDYMDEPPMDISNTKMPY